jgi:hypothetical protein
MTGKLNADASHASAETLAFFDEAGALVLCRAVLTRRPAEGIAYRLSLLSLRVPHRLKKLCSQMLGAKDTYQLAA